MQTGASNTNIPVRVMSPGDDGDVEQTNSVESDATAANINATGQSADQAERAARAPRPPWARKADSEQNAAAASAAEAEGREEHEHLRPRPEPRQGRQRDAVQHRHLLGRGREPNLTGQKAVVQGAGGTQAIGQKCKSDQSALALSVAKQDQATNENIQFALSPGKGGDVTQSNSVDVQAAAGNLNGIKQNADQGPGRLGSAAASRHQAIGQ